MTKRLSSLHGALNGPPFYVLIPARYDSVRLPGKPLIDLDGKPMVIRVAEQAALSGAKRVLVATDDERIRQAVNAHGFEVCMTAAKHVSGTDRIAEVAMQQGWPDDVIVVNVQGDEPLIAPSLIAEVAATLNGNRSVAMATACYPISANADYLNPNVVKVVLDDHGYAMYFSRAPIPFNKNKTALADANNFCAYRHIGIYAYSVKFLKLFANTPASALEQMEGLEQLRALQRGHKIIVHLCNQAPLGGVDTWEDLNAVRAHLCSG